MIKWYFCLDCLKVKRKRVVRPIYPVKNTFAAIKQLRVQHLCFPRYHCRQQVFERSWSYETFNTHLNAYLRPLRQLETLSTNTDRVTLVIMTAKAVAGQTMFTYLIGKNENSVEQAVCKLCWNLIVRVTEIFWTFVDDLPFNNLGQSVVTGFWARDSYLGSPIGKTVMIGGFLLKFFVLLLICTRVLSHL